MATMTVWKFSTSNGAAIAEETLKDLQRKELIQIHDAAIVTYPEGASMTDVGIDDAFIRRMRDEIQPGTSALFVLSSGAVVDKVKDAFRGQEMTLVETNLSHEQEDKLREVFAEDEAHVTAG
jgi:uncharacterized membrane protein